MRMMNIIEPCCAERQLPALLREQKGRAVLFQTYGDVTFENILRSVSCMAGDDHLTMILAVREFTDKMRRIVQRYQERGWITDFRLLVGDTNGEAIVIDGAHGTVMIQGPVIDTRLSDAKPVLYAGQFTADTANAQLAALLASRYSLLERKAAAVAADSADSKPKKSRTRKTQKNDEKSNEKMA